MITPLPVADPGLTSALLSACHGHSLLHAQAALESAMAYIAAAHLSPMQRVELLVPAGLRAVRRAELIVARPQGYA